MPGANIFTYIPYIFPRWYILRRKPAKLSRVKGVLTGLNRALTGQDWPPGLARGAGQICQGGTIYILNPSRPRLAYLGRFYAII